MTPRQVASQKFIKDLAMADLTPPEESVTRVIFETGYIAGMNEIGKKILEAGHMDAAAIILCAVEEEIKVGPGPLRKDTVH